MKLGALALRGVVGGLFIGHGTQKLFGWFGGHELEGTGGLFETLGLRPGKRHATAAGVAEAGGGALLVFGAFTPLAASVLIATMITAIRKVHAKAGPWASEGGYEYNLVLILAIAGLVDHGPGPLSFDQARLPRAHGPALALASVGAGVLGSYLATERFSEPAPDDDGAQGQVAGDPASAADGSESASTAAATS
jgi:putative oxidoreductase